MAATDTRRRILDAALACFLEDGYEQTAIARIRERSDTSNGALFHHFPSKEAIADSLYVYAIASFQEGLTLELVAEDGSVVARWQVMAELVAVELLSDQGGA